MGQPSSSAVALGEICKRAGAVARTSRLTLKRELKKDGSIVTNADKDVEMFLRGELAPFVPGSSFWGEEFGHDGETDGPLWLVDPIDGTSNFAFGSPLWGVSVGLLIDGKIQLGCIYLPDLEELYVAEDGKGAFMNGGDLPPIPPGPVKPEELVGYSDWILRNYPGFQPPDKMRLSGAFVIDGTFTAKQRLRGLIGCRERLYDVAASLVIAKELGAEIRYTDGSELDLAELSKPVQIPKPWLIFPEGAGFYYKKP